MRTKCAAILVVVLMVVSIFAGCAQKPAEKPSAQPKPAAVQTPTPPAHATKKWEKPAQPPEQLFSNKPALTLRAALVCKTPAAMGIVPQIIISPDSRHFATKEILQDGKSRVVTDSGAGGEYDGIDVSNIMLSPGSDFIVFSPDSTHLAYSVRIRNNAHSVVLDGQETPVTGPADMFVFSPDSNHFAYRVRAENVCVVHDGAKDKAYADATGLVYSPDSKRMAYAASPDGQKWCVVLDGAEGKVYDKVTWLLFSGDSQHFAYAAYAGGVWHVVLDGKELKGYPNITDGEFCGDSKTIAYLAGQSGAFTLVMNETEQPAYNTLPVFSPDGKHWANAMVEGGKKRAVIDDEYEANQYDEIKFFTWSPDSKRLGYIAKTAGGWACVLDGEEGKAYDNITAKSLRYSPDSRHFGYVAQAKNGQCVVLDGVEGKAYTSIEPPQREQQTQRVLIGAGYFFFSPDGRHIAYCAASANGDVVVVDGSEIATVLESWGNLLFGEPGKIHAIMLQGGDIYSVEITYTEK